MPLSTLNRALHESFVNWGFTPHREEHIYSSMVAISKTSHEHKVYIYFEEDTGDFHLRSVVEPHGTADYLTLNTTLTSDLGGLDVEENGYVLLKTKQFPIAQAEEDFIEVLSKAMWIGHRAFHTGEKVRKNRARFHDLCTKIGRRLDAPDNMDNQDLRQFVGWAREALDLNPNKELWSVILGGAGKNALHFWSLGEGKMSQETWDRAAEFLTNYGARRGWSLH